MKDVVSHDCYDTAVRLLCSVLELVDNFGS